MAANTLTSTTRLYLTCIRNTLEAAMCLQDFSRTFVKSQKCLIQTSINSLCISIKVKQANELENILTKRFVQFLSMRAEAFQVLTKKPVQDIDKEIYELKLSVNTRGKLVATEFLKQFL